MRIRFALRFFGIAAVIVLFPILAVAGPMVTYVAGSLGGGLWKYHLTIDNTGGTEPLAGLIIWNGNSVFDLDDTSEISQPTNWGNIPPVAGLADGMFYYSLGAASDVAIGASKSGFWFESSMDPSMLSGDDFEVVGIGGRSDEQIPLGNALAVPEPATLLLCGVGIAALKRKAGLSLA